MSQLGVVYLTTLATPHSRALLDQALRLFLQSLPEDIPSLEAPYKLYYEQAAGSTDLSVKGNTLTLPSARLDLVLGDTVLEGTRTAWRNVVPDADEAEYMQFPDREGVGDEGDDLYD